MARVLRIEYDGMFAHVLSRGNERQAIFRVGECGVNSSNIN